jgi:hypothetical protein
MESFSTITSIAAAWGLLPGNDSDWIAGISLGWTLFTSLRSSARQKELEKEQRKLQDRQHELETSKAVRISLNLHHDIFANLVELNKIEITYPELFIYISKNHDKENFVVPPSEYDKYYESVPYAERVELLNAKACGFLYLQINILDMYFIYKDTELNHASFKGSEDSHGELQVNESVPADNNTISEQDQKFDGPADVEAWLSYTNTIMSRPLYRSFYDITEREWGRPFREYMKSLKKEDK